MKIIKKLTAAALAACMALSFTAAQTSEITSVPDVCDDFFIANNISDIEGKANENEPVHWSDVLGYGIETVQNELAENQPIEPMMHDENRTSPYGDETIGTFTKEELEEMGAWEIGMGSYEPYTGEEAEFIIDRLLEIKEPEDSIAFDHGDIYLDIRWRGKTISSEGFPSYMPYEDTGTSANPLSLDPYSRVKVSQIIA